MGSNLPVNSNIVLHALLLENVNCKPGLCAYELEISTTVCNLAEVYANCWQIATARQQVRAC